jgi:peroxidase
LTTPDNGNIKLDLFALNLQRGRDHGICSIQQARQTLGLNPQATFGDIFAGPAKADKLKNAYGSLDKVDLWLGIIG